PLSNILSLAFLQCSIIDNFSEEFKITHVDVRSWKSKVLGSAKATKEDAIKFVQERYPYVDLTIGSNKKPVYCEHLADAICISLYPDKDMSYIENNLVNFM